MGRFADGNVWARRAVEFGTRHDVLLAQALGYEFLGENSMNAGDWQKALEYAEREREIAARLHSRERHAWTYLVTSLSYTASDNMELAEHEMREGVELAESIGEQRLAILLKGNLAMLLADKGRLDDALKMAQENYQSAEVLGLLFSRTEGRRSLAHVYFKRGELNETLRLCNEILEFVGQVTSRISRLWLGPLHIEALLLAGRREEAIQRLAEYEVLVSRRQAPRREQDVVRLKALLSGS